MDRNSPATQRSTTRRTFTKFGPLLAAMAILLSLAGPVGASDQVPFRGSFAGTVTVTPVNPPVASVVIAGAGAGARLGRFTVAIPHIVNQATRTGAGSYAFTAANGDTLTATFTGQATLVAPGVLSVTETAVVTGGTGRFAGATGAFTAQRTFFISTGVTTGSFAGTVSTPGAN